MTALREPRKCLFLAGNGFHVPFDFAPYGSHSTHGKMALDVRGEQIK
jgi:hypothetical protein